MGRDLQCVLFSVAVDNGVSLGFRGCCTASPLHDDIAGEVPPSLQR